MDVSLLKLEAFGRVGITYDSETAIVEKYLLFTRNSKILNSIELDHNDFFLLTTSVLLHNPGWVLCKVFSISMNDDQEFCDFVNMTEGIAVKLSDMHDHR